MANKSRGHSHNKTPKLFPTGTDISSLTTELELKKELLDKIDKKNSQLFSENERLNRENEILERDKEAALSRLSKITGEKLSKGNPFITDLGDPNRPTKLGERWSSLYTDEWTDAFEEISAKCKTNKTVVPEKILLKIVDNQNINAKCNMTVSEVDDSIKSFIETFRSQSQNNERLMEKAVKKCVDDYLSSNKEASENEIFFVKKCLELCWCI